MCLIFHLRLRYIYLGSYVLFKNHGRDRHSRTVYETSKYLELIECVSNALLTYRFPVH